MIVAVLLCLLLASSPTNTLNNAGDPVQELADSLALFRGLDSVISYFRNNTEPLAQRILSTFERECFYVNDPVVPHFEDPKRKPFVVIEGAYRPSRDNLAMRLARLIDGRYLNHPAPCLIRYLQQLPAGSYLRRAYYVLSLYANDFNVRVQLAAGRPVVLNGCWLDQLTFSAVQSYPESQPPVTSAVFRWPADLMQPDLIIYLTRPDGYQHHSAKARRPANHWQTRCLNMYTELAKIYPIVMEDHKITPEATYQRVVDNLATMRDVQVLDFEDESQHNFGLNLYYGLEGILEYFRNHTNSLTKRILWTFENECCFREPPSIPTDQKRKPFVVVEGNAHNSRDVIGKALARKLNARYMVHPASCLVKFLDIIPKGTILRRAYYILSLYAMANNVRAHLSTNRAVVLNGYWLDQLTFTLIQSLPPDHMPHITSDTFKMPAELITPDIICYLHLRDDIRTIDPGTNLAFPNWHQRAMKLYQSLQNLYPIVIEELIGDDVTTTNNLYQHVRDRLSDTREVVLQDYDEISQVVKLFSGLDAVLEYFQNNANPLADTIVTTFHRHCIFRPDKNDGPLKPFIVVEGNNRTSRDIVAGRLARAMGGMTIKHPAPCLRDLMGQLPRSSLLRRAYYVLSLYAMSMEVSRQLVISPVILNGYWLDQLTFALIQSFPYGRLPTINSTVYSWPKGLLQPDLNIYLNHPDHLHHASLLTRSHKNWKPRSLELYRQLQQRYKVLIQEMGVDHWKTTDEILHTISQVL